MKKIFIIMILLILLTSCTKQGSLQGSQEILKSNTGTDALQINFLESPLKTSINNEYRIISRLKNIGEHDTDIKIVVGGYSSSTVNNNPESSFSLTKDDEHDLELSFTSTSVPPTNKEFFTIQACYNYKTLASFPICINPTKSNQVCKTNTVTQAGQGAPIAVTKVVPTITNNKLHLEITVENKGSGRLTEKNNCFGDPKIEVTNVELSGTKLICDVTELSLKGLENNILKCDYVIPDTTQAYTTPLTVELSYGYAQTKSTTVTIEK